MLKSRNVHGSTRYDIEINRSRWNRWDRVATTDNKADAERWFYYYLTKDLEKTSVIRTAQFGDK